LQARQQHLAQLQEALDGDRVRRFALADKLARKPEALPDILRTWLSWWRDMALLAHPSPSREAVAPISNIDEQRQLTSLAQIWSREAVLESYKQTGLALWQLERNANTRLAIEILFLTYPLPGAGRGK
jgi:DNA polymerase III gamma/tau subunit